MLPFSPVYLVFAAFVLAALQLARCLASPLRKLPGPTISLFTPLVLKWKEINAERTLYIHALHQRYGPVVRISPNEVSYTSWPALKEIYCSGGSGYDKSDFYNLFRIYGRRFASLFLISFGCQNFQEGCSDTSCSNNRTMFTILNKADVSGETV